MLLIVSFSKHKTHALQDSHWYSHSLQLKICKIQKQKKDQNLFPVYKQFKPVSTIYAGEQSNLNTLHKIVVLIDV